MLIIVKTIPRQVMLNKNKVLSHTSFRFTMKIFFSIMLFLCSLTAAKAQHENAGWLFLTHKQEISKKIDLRADVQLRSADRLAYLSALLLRGAVSYNIDKINSVALGYAFLGKWDQDESAGITSAEHRIFEQYMVQGKLAKAEVSTRLRLEQRFLDQSGANFSQRGRLFISAQIPVLANEDFSKGMYMGLQNELFLNLHHKQNVNGSTFDQNRSFASVGYRWSKKIDTELGYMYWLQKESEGMVKQNVVQVMVTTSF